MNRGMRSKPPQSGKAEAWLKAWGQGAANTARPIPHCLDPASLTGGLLSLKGNCNSWKGGWGSHPVNLCRSNFNCVLSVHVTTHVPIGSQQGSGALAKTSFQPQMIIKTPFMLHACSWPRTRWCNFNILLYLILTTAPFIHSSVCSFIEPTHFFLSPYSEQTSEIQEWCAKCNTERRFQYGWQASTSKKTNSRNYCKLQ